MAEPEPVADDPPLPLTRPEPWVEPECSFDWPGANLSAPFLAALARAQASITTVGKTARAEAGAGAPAYDYATNDALVGELRRAFAAQGIAFVSSYRVLAPPDLRISDRQWMDWTVVLDFALLYGDVGLPAATMSDGKARPEAMPATGWLRGHASCCAIGSAGRPPDKSLFAARTSCAGAVAIGLGAIDRAKVSKDEDINQRPHDDEATGGGNRRVVSRAETNAHSNAKDRMAKALQTLTAARKAAGLPRRSYPELCAEAMGEGFEPTSATQADLCADALLQAAADLRGDGDPT
jgi:hypothetical protein